MMEFVNGKDDIPYMKWKKTCLKPPTSRTIQKSFCQTASKAKRKKNRGSFHGDADEGDAWGYGFERFDPHRFCKGILNLLGGGIATHLKNMKVSWDDYSQYMEK